MAGEAWWCGLAGVLAVGCTFGSSGSSGGGSGLAAGSSGSDDGRATASDGSVAEGGPAADADASGDAAGTSASTGSAVSGPFGSSDDTSGGSAEISSGSTAEATTGPVAPEVCDGIDNDGDGGVDEGSPQNAACNDCTFLLSAGGDRWFAVCTDTMPWDDARIDCGDFGPGADLAMIDDQADQAALLRLVVGDYWLGMSDVAEEGHWVWVDGSDAIVGGNVIGFNGWALGQPEGGSENCGEMDSTKSGWADTSCGALQPSICQHPA